MATLLTNSNSKIPSLSNLAKISKKAISNTKKLVEFSKIQQLLTIKHNNNEYSKIEELLNIIGFSNKQYKVCIIFKTFEQLQDIITKLGLSRSFSKRVSRSIKYSAKSITATLKRKSSLKPCDKSVLYDIIKENTSESEKDTIFKRFNEYLNDKKCIDNICDGKTIYVFRNKHSTYFKNENLFKDNTDDEITDYIFQIVYFIGKQKIKTIVQNFRSTHQKTQSLKINNSNTQLNTLPPEDYLRSLRDDYYIANTEIKKQNILNGEATFKYYLTKYENTYKKKLIDYIEQYNQDSKHTILCRLCGSFILFLDNLFDTSGGFRTKDSITTLSSAIDSIDKEIDSELQAQLGSVTAPISLNINSIPNVPTNTKISTKTSRTTGKSRVSVI